MTDTRSPAGIGRAAVAASAVVFGFTPVMAALSYRGGSNGVNMAFLRALLPLPVLWLLARRQGRVSAAGLRQGILPGILLFGCMLMLYSSYQYISPGPATTLHFLYPLLVYVYEALVQKKRLGRLRRCGVAAAMIGVAVMADFRQQRMDVRGVALAVISAFLYTAYMISLEKPSVRAVPLYRLMTGISLTGCAVCGVCGMILGRITLRLTGEAWLCAAVAALLTAVVGCVLFQFGVRKAGKADAAVFSLLEPLTSVFFSVLLLRESLTFRSAAGCALIILGLLLAAMDREKRPGET